MLLLDSWKLVLSFFHRNLLSNRLMNLKVKYFSLMEKQTPAEWKYSFLKQTQKRLCKNMQNIYDKSVIGANMVKYHQNLFLKWNKEERRKIIFGKY